MDNQTCIFCKIARHEVPKEFVYEDEDVMVFPDIRPLRPTHLLIVPKQHVADFLDVSDAMLLNKIRLVAQNLVRQFGLLTTGYRLVLNGGGAQQIDHLHVHLMGPMGKRI